MLQVRAQRATAAASAGDETASDASSDDGWLDVSVPPRARSDAEAGAIVNTGLQLPYWTNDVWRATPHRVVSRSAAEADESRYSIACFIDADADARVAVDPRFVPEGARAKYPPTTGREYLQRAIREAQRAPAA